MFALEESCGLLTERLRADFWDLNICLTLRASVYINAFLHGCMYVCENSDLHVHVLKEIYIFIFIHDINI